MIDSVTRERVKVLTEGDTVPYLMIAYEQLEALTDALKREQIPHWVEEDVISIDGEPAVAVVNLGRRADPQRVQRLIDELG